MEDDQLTIILAPEERRALAKFTAGLGGTASQDQTAHWLLKDALVRTGFLEVDSEAP